jgi:lipopolysaccharide biosynthesis glycosyltransferase
LVNLDILELQNFISDKVIGAVEWRRFYYAIEKEFLIKKLNLNPETSYFNSGVLVINIDQWHKENISDKIHDIGKRYSDELQIADQTILNTLFKGDYTQVPKRFNTGLSITQYNVDSKGAIVHFVGSIKPWDILGNKIHNGYEYWNVYQTLFWKKSYKKITYNKLIKVWELKRLYAKRVLLMLLKSITVL